MSVLRKISHPCNCIQIIIRLVTHSGSGYTFFVMAGQKTRFFGSVWGILYIFASCAQTLSIVDTVPEYITGASTGISFLVAFAVAELPFIGSAAGIYGAYVNWDLPIAMGIALFIWPIVILFVYLLKYRSPVDAGYGDTVISTTANETVEVAAAEAPTISPWMANVLKDQVDSEESAIPSVEGHDDVIPGEAIVVETDARGDSESDAIDAAATNAVEPKPDFEAESAKTDVEDAEFVKVEAVDTEVEEAEVVEAKVVEAKVAETGVVEAEAEVVEVEAEETEVAETEVAETEVAETEVVEVEVVETEVVVAEVVETEVVETEVVETEVVETEVVETEVVETAAAETEVVDVEIVEAEVAETEVAETEPQTYSMTAAEIEVPETEIVEAADMIEPEAEQPDPGIVASDASENEPAPAAEPESEPEADDSDESETESETETEIETAIAPPPESVAAVQKIDTVDAVDEQIVVETTVDAIAAEIPNVRTKFDVIRDHAALCRSVLYERTNAETIPPLARSIDAELPQLFAVLGILTVSDMTEADVVSRVLVPGSDSADLGEGELRNRLDERVVYYQASLGDERGNAGNLFARKVGRIGDGLMIRIVNDSVSDCRAALTAG